jgi:hypothetical protein
MERNIKEHAVTVDKSQAKVIRFTYGPTAGASDAVTTEYIRERTPSPPPTHWRKHSPPSDRSSSTSQKRRHSRSHSPGNVDRVSTVSDYFVPSKQTRVQTSDRGSRRSSSPIIDRDNLTSSRRSRHSPSPKSDRGNSSSTRRRRSPSPIDDYEKSRSINKRRRSPSPISSRRRRSPSLIDDSGKYTSFIRDNRRSPSQIDGRRHSGSSRSRRSRSRESERSLSHSNRRRARSPSPEYVSSRSKSKRSRSPSPVRSRTRRSRSPSSAHSYSRSCEASHHSLIISRENVRSDKRRSPSVELFYKEPSRRSQSPKSGHDRKSRESRRRSASPGPESDTVRYSGGHEEHRPSSSQRSDSGSGSTRLPRPSSRSPPPVNWKKARSRSSSPPPLNWKQQVRSRSPDPPQQQQQLGPSPVQQWKTRSPSPQSSTQRKRFDYSQKQSLDTRVTADYTQKQSDMRQTASSSDPQHSQLEHGQGWNQADASGFRQQTAPSDYSQFQTNQPLGGMAQSYSQPGSNSFATPDQRGMLSLNNHVMYIMYSENWNLTKYLLTKLI